MNSTRDRLRLTPAAASPLTLAVGTVTVGRGVRPYTMSNNERDRLLAAAECEQGGQYITRPSGNPEEDKQTRSRHDAAGWDDRQQSAARTLKKFWRNSLPGMAKPGGVGSCMNFVVKGEHHLSPEEEEKAADAWRSYQDAMDYLVQHAGQKHRNAVMSAVIMDDAPTLDVAWRVRESLKLLADYWWPRK